MDEKLKKELWPSDPVTSLDRRDPRWLRATLLKANWDESKYTRASDGKFGSGSGASQPAADDEPSEPPDGSRRNLGNDAWVKSGGLWYREKDGAPEAGRQMFDGPTLPAERDPDQPFQVTGLSDEELDSPLGPDFVRDVANGPPASEVGEAKVRRQVEAIQENMDYPDVQMGAAQRYIKATNGSSAWGWRVHDALVAGERKDYEAERASAAAQGEDTWEWDRAIRQLDKRAAKVEGLRPIGKAFDVKFRI